MKRFSIATAMLVALSAAGAQIQGDTMQNRRKRLPAIILAVSLFWQGSFASASTVTLSRASGPTPLASVSCDHMPGSVFEPAVAIDPRDPQHMVAAWLQDGTGFSDGVGIVAAATKDGGVSWTRTVLPGEVQCVTPFNNVVDPRVAIGPDGIVYVATLPEGPPRPGITEVYVHRSLDGGITWQPPVAVSEPTILADFPSIVAVPDRQGSAIVVWSGLGDFLGTLLSRTDDGGVTWSLPSVVRLASPGTYTGQRIAALSGDRLTIVYVDTPIASHFGAPLPSSPLMAIHSSDGGATWSTPVQVSASPFDVSYDVSSTPSGVLFAVFQHAGQNGESLVYVSRSEDGGETWSSQVLAAVQHPVQPNTAPRPGAAIGANDDHVLLLYDDASGSTAVVRIARSDDGGVTWTDQAITQPFAMGTYDIGDYQQISVTDSGFAGAMVMGGQYAIDGPTDVYVATGGF